MITNFKRQPISIFLLILTIFSYSCKQVKVDNQKIQTVIIKHESDKDSLWQKVNENIHFIGSTLLQGKDFVLKNYLKKYQPDSCGILAYSDKQLKENFEGVKSAGDINGDKINDTVFVVPAFNY